MTLLLGGFGGTGPMRKPGIIQTLLGLATIVTFLVILPAFWIYQSVTLYLSGAPFMQYFIPTANILMLLLVIATARLAMSYHGGGEWS